MNIIVRLNHHLHLKTAIRQLASVALLVASFWSAAQQPQVFNQFFMNPYIYNPAYAGVEGHAAFFVTYRDQWTNIESAPTLSDVSFHVPLKGGIALGVSAFNITQDPLITSAAKITGSYLINIDRTHFLRFGMSLGAGVNSVDLNALEDIGTDGAFAGFLDQSSFFLGDFGVTYHFGHFNMGMALPNLFSYNPITQSTLTTVKFSSLDNVLFKMNYRGHINDNFAFEPHLIYRYSNVIPHQYEVVLITHLYHVVWVGASYRQDNNIIGLAGAKIKEKIGVGFSYGLGNVNVASQLGPTLEVTLGYHLGTKKEHAAHVSSFIKSHRLSAEERAKKAALERQKQLLALKESREASAAEESDARENEEDELSIVQTKSTLKGNKPEAETPTEKADWDHKEEHETITRINQFGEEEKGIRLESEGENGEKNIVLSWIKAEHTDSLKVAEEGHLERVLPDGTKEIGVKYETKDSDGEELHVIKWDKAISNHQAEVIKANPDLTEAHHDQIERSDPTLTDDFRTHEELATSTDYVRTKRGSNLLELPTGNFVIGGAFNSFDNAVGYSDTLFQDGYQDCFVGYSSARGYYYVVVYTASNVKQAIMRKRQLRKTPKLSGAWVLQVRK